MKALVWTDKQVVEMQEREVPDYTGKVLIKVAYAGICGSDVSVYLGKHPRAKTPLIMGHEFSGVVEAIGQGVDTPLKPGDRVVVDPLYYCGRCRACLAGNTHVCRSLRLYGTDADGGMAQYVAVPEQTVLKLPDSISLKMAAVIEPTAVVVHGLRMVRKPFYGSAAVTGLGPMGLLTALMLREAGIRDLYCVEANPQRAAYGRKLGLHVIDPVTTDTVDEILRLTDGEGVELLVEASGAAAVAKTMAEMTAVRGEILLLSVFKEPAAVDLRSVNFREQSIVGTRVYTALDFQDAVTYVSRHEDLVGSIVSHVRPLEDGQAVFQDIISGHTDTMKVLLQV